MTLETFLKKLEQTPRDWYFANKCIRRGPKEKDKRQCPLSALCDLSAEEPFLAADIMKLPVIDALHVIDAADEFSRHDRDLRAKLLKACGLEAK